MTQPSPTELIQALQQTISPNPNELKAAQEYIEQLKNRSFPEFFYQCVKILSNLENPGIARYQACLQAKNVITSKNENKKLEILNRWNSEFPENTKLEIKNLILGALGTVTINNVYKRPSGTAQLIAGLAGLELPEKKWPDLLKSLSDKVCDQTGQTSDTVKEASLEAIGYICADVDTDVVAEYTSSVLTAIVHGMKSGANIYIKLAATNAMFNSLEFIKDNFEKPNERDYIMQVICELTQQTDSRQQVASLQCLVKIVTLYYDFMENYMGRALFGITQGAMKSDEDGVVLQGIEFWSNVCDEEYDLAYMAQEAWEKGTPPDRHSKHYAKGALPHLTPILCQTLAKQEENDDDWSPSKAAAVCLSLLANVTEDDILPLVIPFIEQNIAKPDWQFRDAAVVSLGSILDGPTPDQLESLLEPAMGTLIALFDDESIAVRDSVAWCISKICELVPNLVFNDVIFNNLLQKLVVGLQAPPRVASNVCWAINTLVVAIYNNAEGDEETGTVKTYQLSKDFKAIITALLETTNRADGNEHNLRSAAYEAIMEMIKCSPDDCYQCVIDTTEEIMKRIHQLLGGFGWRTDVNDSTFNATDRSQLADMQSLLCGTLQSVLRKIKPEHISTMSDQVMTALLTMLAQNKQSATKTNSSDEDEEVNYEGVHEDALLAVGTLAGVAGERFGNYMPTFLPFLQKALTNYEEGEVCKAAVGVIGDITRALGAKFSDYCEVLMTQLLTALNSSELDQTVRPHILNLFGDIAIAVGNNFVRYLEYVMQALRGVLVGS